MKQRDKNRAELVRAIIRQNGGRIFTVIAARKTPKNYFTIDYICSSADVSLLNGKEEGDKVYLNTKKAKQLFETMKECRFCEVTEHKEYFMTMTCRTGVKNQLASKKIQGYKLSDPEYANPFSPLQITEMEYEQLTKADQWHYEPVYKETKSTIAHDENLISINLTNGKGYRCFSAFNVLELRASGTVIKFKPEDVLNFEE